MFRDKVLLITGGTGSFGNAVLSRFLHSDFAEIRIFSRDEKKQEDMRIALKSDKVKFYIGDVRRYDSVHDALARRGLRVPRGRAEAGALLRVLSDGGGAYERDRRRKRDARGNRARRVRRCVVLSTDKAVYPINAMGMSKAMMEKVMVAKCASRPGARQYCAHSLRQRDGLAGLGDPAVPTADS